MAVGRVQNRCGVPVPRKHVDMFKIHGRVSQPIGGSRKDYRRTSDHLSGSKAAAGIVGHLRDQKLISISWNLGHTRAIAPTTANSLTELKPASARNVFAASILLNQLFTFSLSRI